LGQKGDCDVYTLNSSTFCKSESGDCGKCLNPGGRAGVMCTENPSGGTTGYLCQTQSYACMDWTFGSQTLLKAEADFAAATGDKVYFGVGTFGTSQKLGLGMCYRIKVQGVDRDLIVQAINTGGDVQGNQFDLQVGDGGFGANNRCVGCSTSMFSGSPDVWGDIYGGVRYRDNCSALPLYPSSPDPMKHAGDTLVFLCQYSFDKKVRLEPGPNVVSSNPTITDMARVKCPEGLVNVTQIQKTDDPDNYTGPSMAGFPNTDVICQKKVSSDLSYCLTRMMDCCKPTGGWTDNINLDLGVPTRKVVQVCTQDGYTRLDVQCGCWNCWC